MKLPDPLATLVARLEDSDFAIISEQQRDGFGNGMITLTRLPMAVRVVADRGEWFIELRHDDWEDWFDPDLWRSCLDSDPAPDEPRPLREQAEFVLSDFDGITAAATGEPGALLSCLQEARATRSRRRLGFHE